MIAAVVHFVVYPIEDVKISLLWLAWWWRSACLMSSTLRYYSFKDIQWTKRQPSLAVVLIALAHRRDGVLVETDSARRSLAPTLFTAWCFKSCARCATDSLPAPPETCPPGPEAANRVAIVGASSLRGKELKQVLEDRNFPAEEIVLLDESVMAGTLTEAGGEPTFIRALDEDSFDRRALRVFCRDAPSMRNTIGRRRNTPAPR